METSLKILYCSASFAPEYGGPARSVSGLAHSLAQLGCEVGIWASDGSARSNAFLDRDSRVRQLGGDFKSAVKNFGVVDLIHDSGIWLPHNHAIARHCRDNAMPRVVSTRGMLEPWARKHQRLKKWLAWNSYQRSDLQQADAIHVTGEVESQSIGKLGFSDPWVVPNGIRLPLGGRESLFERSEKRLDSKMRTALFLGRLHPIKGLPMLLKAWAEIRPENWKLRIVGPDEVGHRLELEMLVQEKGLQQVVSIGGELDEIQKWQAMEEASLFICPSYSENFGIAIAEALASGLPVLTTIGTPWRAIQKKELGWWVAPSVYHIARALKTATECDSTSLLEMGLNAREYVTSTFTWEQIGAQMLQHYGQLLRRTTRDQ